MPEVKQVARKPSNGSNVGVSKTLPHQTKSATDCRISTGLFDAGDHRNGDAGGLG